MLHVSKTYQNYQYRYKNQKSAPGEGFCNSIANSMSVYNSDLWINFKDYLVAQRQSPHTIRNKLQYVKKFYGVLEKEDAKCLLNLSVETRQHAMKSLSSLSKYLGIYDKWLDLIERSS